jgi:UDP-3-O-[3-hydroxymyristoyl] glucosamine N-acyltransferase
LKYRLEDLCEKIGMKCSGGDKSIAAIKTLKEAGPEDLSFFHSEKYIDDLAATRAAAVILDGRYSGSLPEGVVALETDEPYVKFALATALFAHRFETGVNKPDIGEGCRIDPSASFCSNVKIGDNTVIMAGVYIGDNAVIGNDCLIHPNVSIYHETRIGDRCIVHSGSVIGADGYGFATDKTGRHIKIHQIGDVVIEDDVEIGSNVSIDRGALGSTIIGRGTKIDNLVQIAHNIVIGENCLIVAQAGMAGSSRLGRNTVLGAQSGVAGHLRLGDFTIVAARGGVTKTLEGGRTYGGFPAVEIGLWRRMQAVLMRLTKNKGR